MSLLELEQSKKPKHYLREIIEVVLEEDMHEVVNIDKHPLNLQIRLTKNLPGQQKYKIYFQILNKITSDVLNYGVVFFSNMDDPEFNKLINIFEIEFEKHKDFDELHLNPEKNSNPENVEMIQKC